MIVFPISYLNAGELLTVGESFLPIISPITPEFDTLIPKLKPVLQKDVQDLSIVLLRSQSSAYTQMLSDLDDDFDNGFTTLRDFCIVMSKQSTDEAVAAAAKKIVEVINSVNSQMHESGYAQELAESLALTNKLDEEEYQQALSDCNALPWYDIFKNARDAFRAGYDQKINDESKEDALTLKPIKVAIRRHIMAVYSHLDVLTELEPQVFDSYAAKLEGVVRSIVPAARARRTRNASSEVEIPETQVNTTSPEDIASAGDIAPAVS